MHLYYAGERDSAYNLLENIATRFEGARIWKGFLYLQEGKYETALHELEKQEDFSTPFTLTLYGLAYSRTGQQAMTRKVLDNLEARSSGEFISHTLRGALLAELGMNSEAIEYLRRGYEEREEYLIMLMHFDRIAYSSLRSDPGYLKIMQKVQPK